MVTKTEREGRIARISVIFSQKAMFPDWIPGFGFWFMQFDSWPLDFLLDKAILTLGNPNLPKDREAGGLVGGEVEEAEA